MVITRAAWVSMVQRIEAAIALARTVRFVQAGGALPVATTVGATKVSAASEARAAPTANPQLSPACLAFIANFDVTKSKAGKVVRLGDSSKQQLVWSLVEHCLPVHGTANGLVFPSHLP